jgi:hypothetical protein
MLMKRLAWFGFALCFAVAPFSVAVAAPQPLSPYVIEDKPPTKDGFSLVTLRNRSTKRALWQHQILGYKYTPVTWSPNHRALVIYQGGTLLVWREGKPLLEIGAPAVPGSKGTDHYDYSMGSVWSPDAKRLLVRFGLSGMSDFDAGRLFCLTFRGKNSKYSFLPSGYYVKDMKWRSNRVASYRPFLDDIYQVIGKPRLWRVP